MADIWISGPVTGHADLNRPAFEAARVRLSCLGNVTIPHDIVPRDAEHDVAMRICINHIGFRADAIVMLPGWRGSKGACMERDFAETMCGIPVLEVVA